MKPRIFVGTMFCGEGDFEKCCEMISSQQGVEIEHSVISNLSEKEAHNALWKTWRAQKESGEFSLFVKIDADTVLASEYTLHEIWRVMSSDPHITSLQAPLHDYFRNEFINGLNCFTPKVIFNDTKDDLYCDRVDSGHNIQLHANQLPPSLKPAGFHCHYASKSQAFHYGLHRALKRQQDTLVSVTRAFKDHGDLLRQYALAGFKPKYYQKFETQHNFNYSDELFCKTFKEVEAELEEKTL